MQGVSERLLSGPFSLNPTLLSEGRSERQGASAAELKYVARVYCYRRKETLVLEREMSERSVHPSFRARTSTRAASDGIVPKSRWNSARARGTGSGDGVRSTRWRDSLCSSRDEFGSPANATGRVASRGEKHRPVSVAPRQIRAERPPAIRRVASTRSILL